MANINHQNNVFIQEMRTCLKNFGDGFKCSICLDFYINPMMLPCTHAICAECAEAALQAKQECPVCKKTDNVTRRSLTRNDNVSKIVQAFKGVAEAFDLTNYEPITEAQMKASKASSSKQRNEHLSSAKNAADVIIKPPNNGQDGSKSRSSSSSSSSSNSIVVGDAKNRPRPKQSKKKSRSVSPSVPNSTSSSANRGSSKRRGRSSSPPPYSSKTTPTKRQNKRQTSASSTSSGTRFSTRGKNIEKVEKTPNISANEYGEGFDIEPLRSGEQVTVMGRHWPGINKEGGVAWVKKVYEPINGVVTADVKLVLGGAYYKQIELCYLKRTIEGVDNNGLLSDTKCTRSSMSSCSSLTSPVRAQRSPPKRGGSPAEEPPTPPPGFQPPHSSASSCSSSTSKQYPIRPTINFVHCQEEEEEDGESRMDDNDSESEFEFSEFQSSYQRKNKEVIGSSFRSNEKEAEDDGLTDTIQSNNSFLTLNGGGLNRSVNEEEDDGLIDTFQSKEDDDLTDVAQTNENSIQHSTEVICSGIEQQHHSMQNEDDFEDSCFSDGNESELLTLTMNRVDCNKQENNNGEEEEEEEEELVLSIKNQKKGTDQPLVERPKTSMRTKYDFNRKNIKENISEDQQLPETTKQEKLPLFAKGSEVTVAPRVGPGENKPGGPARVVSYDCVAATYSVRYVMGGSDSAVPAAIISEKKAELNRRSRAKKQPEDIGFELAIQHALQLSMQDSAPSSSSCSLPFPSFSTSLKSSSSSSSSSTTNIQKLEVGNKTTKKILGGDHIVNYNEEDSIIIPEEEDDDYYVLLSSSKKRTSNNPVNKNNNNTKSETKHQRNQNSMKRNKNKKSKLKQTTLCCLNSAPASDKGDRKISISRQQQEKLSSPNLIEVTAKYPEFEFSQSTLTSVPPKKRKTASPCPVLSSSQRLVIAFSGFTVSDIERMKRMLSGIANCEITFENEVDKATHLIVKSISLQPNVAEKRTTKYMGALLRGIWLVNAQWVDACRSAQSVVDEAKFEIVKDPKENTTIFGAPKISRLEKTSIPPGHALFAYQRNHQKSPDHYVFCLLKSWWKDPPKLTSSSSLSNLRNNKCVEKRPIIYNEVRKLVLFGQGILLHEKQSQNKQNMIHDDNEIENRMKKKNSSNHQPYLIEKKNQMKRLGQQEKNNNEEDERNNAQEKDEINNLTNIIKSVYDSSNSALPEKGRRKNNGKIQVIFIYDNLCKIDSVTQSWAIPPKQISTNLKKALFQCEYDLSPTCLTNCSSTTSSSLSSNFPFLSKRIDVQLLPLMWLLDSISNHKLQNSSIYGKNLLV